MADQPSDMSLGSQEHTAAVLHHVFSELGVPLLGIDLARVRQVLLHGAASDPTHVAIRLDVAPPERRYALVAALRGLISEIDVPPELVIVFGTSATLRENPVRMRFANRSAAGGATFAVYQKDHSLVWEEDSLWPVGYSALLEQLTMIMFLFRTAIEQRQAELPEFVTMTADYPRLLPTRFHYAAASLGAWLGGATSIQFFALYATEPPIFHSDRNLDYARQVGFSPEEAAKLDASGMVALPPSLVLHLVKAQGQAQGNPVFFGSIGINEVNIANPPRDTERDTRSNKTVHGLLVDKYYRAPFLAHPFHDRGLYGASSVLRDHYEDFYASVNVERLVRCKHYCAPVISVGSLDEMTELVARIPVRSKSGLHFRGQARLFTLARDPAVRRMLFADSCDVEPSLTTSAVRHRYHYDQHHFALKYYLADRIFAQARALDDMTVVEEWGQAAAAADCRLDYALMALAQHYGLPSHGLDVTTDLGVATWFATNSLVVDASGRASYSPQERWDDADDAPVVLVHQTVAHSIGASFQDCQQLERFGVRALRPSRQSARFFLGGHSDHQNRLAEAVVCVFRLRPGDYDTAHAFADLFPPPAEDEAYRVLLEFSEWYEPARSRVLRFHERR